MEVVWLFIVVFGWLIALTAGGSYLMQKMLRDGDIRKVVFDDKWMFRIHVKQALEAIEQDKKAGQEMWDKHIAELADKVRDKLKEEKE